MCLLRWRLADQSQRHYQSLVRRPCNRRSNVRRPLSLVQHLQLPFRQPPTTAQPPPKTPPSSLHRLQRLCRLRHVLQLAARRKDIPASERGQDWLCCCGSERRCDGWLAGRVWKRVEDENYCEWVARIDVFGVVEDFGGSVSATYLLLVECAADLKSLQVG